jgi:chemotaxis protein MotB
MRKTMKTILIVIALISAGAAYYFYDAKTKVESELARSEFEKQMINSYKEKEDGIAPLKGTFAELTADLKNEIEQGQIKIDQSSGRLSIVMVDTILFPSGKAEITLEGSMVLRRVGNVLKNAPDEVIHVDGYIDTMKIAMQLQKKYQTNWELTTARAANIVRFLQEKVGIDEKLLQPIGPSENHPVASNETPGSSRQNRRIEIALLP